MKNKIFRFLIIAILCYLVLGLWEKISDNKERNYEFAGILQKIDFDEKGVLEVVINEKKYYSLSTTRRFSKQMAVGDSLIKRKGSTTYILVKHDTGIVLISKY
ncbi:hypothetical protein J3L18_22395 [Mucilaginibacter gossypii]|uniref:hypothetical protein n=1 Tax=Mucilaginibacter gossypii TaxID=551996 RepID=UPI00101A994D|nr:MULTISPECIES: hypothetical protein [Mucilaginibacter]QTE35877.1 hypothetical protein J3L18_22395 [Mucilaginibacter gossypii]